MRERGEGGRREGEGIARQTFAAGTETTKAHQRNSWASCCEYPLKAGTSLHTALRTA